MRTMATLLLMLSGCGLTKGWARVDFITGQPTDVMVCSFTMAQGDLVGKCADWGVMQEPLKKHDRQRKIDEVRYQR